MKRVKSECTIFSKASVAPVPCGVADVFGHCRPRCCRCTYDIINRAACMGYCDCYKDGVTTEKTVDEISKRLDKKMFSLQVLHTTRY